MLSQTRWFNMTKFNQPRRQKTRPTKGSREVRDRSKTKVVKDRPVLQDPNEDLMDLKRQVARNNGFLICDDCFGYTPLGKTACNHCDATLKN